MKNVTDVTFQADVLDSPQPVLVDFWAEWCGPCKQLAPVLDELSGEMQGKITFTKINIEESPAISSKYGIRSVPTLMIFKGGALVATRPGGGPKSKLTEWISQHI